MKAAGGSSALGCSSSKVLEMSTVLTENVVVSLHSTTASSSSPALNHRLHEEGENASA